LRLLKFEALCGRERGKAEREPAGAGVPGRNRICFCWGERNPEAKPKDLCNSSFA
jgi:hypothetical protein